MFKLSRIPATAALLAGAILSLMPAQAAVVQFSSLSTWSGQVSNITAADTFSDVSTSLTNQITAGGLLRASGVDYVGVNPTDGTYLTSELKTSGSPYYGSWVRGPFGGSDPLAFLQITPPANTNAIGFNLGTYYAATGITITVNGTSFYVPSVPKDLRATWFGVTSDAPITSITLTPDIQYGVLVTNVSLANFASAVGGGNPGGQPGDPAQAPELSSCMMIGSGLWAAVMYSRRRGRASIQAV